MEGEWRAVQPLPKLPPRGKHELFSPRDHQSGGFRTQTMRGAPQGPRMLQASMYTQKILSTGMS